MVKTTDAQQAEIDKYVQLYDTDWYGMSPGRQGLFSIILQELDPEDREGLLDVGCGRGEGLKIATDLGYDPVKGIDPATGSRCGGDLVYGLAWDIPFMVDSFHTSMCFDVMEHIRRDEWEASVKEIGRVTTDRMIFVISNDEDKAGAAIGETLHITTPSYDITNYLLKQWLPKWEVTWRKDLKQVNAEVWEAKCSR